MARYGLLSVTGYSVFDGPERRMPYGLSRKRHDPTTTWYVVDLDMCSEVVGVFATEHEARLDRFRRNAEERRWEKHQDYARNGHA